MQACIHMREGIEALDTMTKKLKKAGQLTSDELWIDIDKMRKALGCNPGKEGGMLRKYRELVDELEF